ncbi:uncharacterized protein MYCFIDRAFT_127396 [Pseudocercospora fijiensis CIRAD86]|uniref:T6SS Phospholipase effector Tle1-like catalytic domain-containing protein n=1 Tax=Pseudocercospora fijiensis (strain CIRAD86) TaxID=383855 RepID=N1Q729_PSEFD|nr:uncharacterized protein MYCFIDRAFT_127396 [Pseudocercospora fijiensis CIRAD86]EME88399.1 hypothetical protein MYCFIDRAFT_127396 [Pseudocercospora fijiensis CIRAD86]
MAEGRPATQVRKRQSLVLCFDGTGNKFQGGQADSNIIKIYGLLDRNDPTQYHYYQPGIGTYVETSSLSRKSTYGRVKSWYSKAKDQAIGTSFGEHVMAGYRFLMRFYNDGDAIYFFGFSRGAYTARFLAQMLDYVGLLSAGNEEMMRFAWKTFSKWQMRSEDTAAERANKQKTFEFMQNFRQTFSRPVVRIEFLGLFDCVNSVPQFESAWMTRTRFPQTSARVIRHAVAIDERRAKFRQDLLSERRQTHPSHHHHMEQWHLQIPGEKGKLTKKQSIQRTLSQPHFRAKQRRRMAIDLGPASSSVSVNSGDVVRHNPRDDDSDGGEEDERQDILELWFAGQHGDVGGGWTLNENEERPISDIALSWMVREARKAGMPFDEEKVQASNLFVEDPGPSADMQPNDIPQLKVEGESVHESDLSRCKLQFTTWHEEMHKLAAEGRVHDSLAFGGGLSRLAVCAWQFMEFMPFRRMDLQKDGKSTFRCSWKAISWPLPRGETRDMSHDCQIHSSVIKRMEADPNYRPGNLIVGGGGRGCRKAPDSFGMVCLAWHQSSCV